MIAASPCYPDFLRMQLAMWQPDLAQANSSATYRDKQIVHGTCFALYLGISFLGLSLSLSLGFNGHIPGEPELAGVYLSKG